MSIDRAGHVARPTHRPYSETGGTGRGVTSSRTFLRTADGVAIDAVHRAGAAGSGSVGDLVFVIAHGFTGDADRPHVRRVAGVLSRYGAVVTFSFRGHGASGGRSTVGDREVLDLAAAVGWARELGYARVATVGFSMGGSVVLRHAAAATAAAAAEEGGGGGGSSVDAVVSVSAPARWFYRGTAPMRRLHWLVTRPSGRVVGRYGLRTRIHHRQWDPVPVSPVEAVPGIAPTPLLIVHGDQDAYFPLDHPRMLAAAAGEHGELWVEPGMGHAENAAPEPLLGRIGDWVVARAG
ncbi:MULTISPECIES: alpha/beta hydrolase [unclassified Streptomyces]|uniref:alpha/beta hydrolase n=1 Tax=unclassified Streptomyces TaxID=2593676 RepID=UPI000F708957|nr:MULTISPECIES: alpha/beta hydrolase [unclassified Streptomyces]AZM61465.1 alpha/beta hydrolase [Streptomyces sp. WAC 01438]RSM98352.1 alpha/beta hydrolase [Streptomyces sp. WAC 01420]